MMSMHADENEKTGKAIFVHTTQYSRFFQAVYERFNKRSQLEIIIDGKTLGSVDEMQDWCTNAHIKGTQRFRLRVDDTLLYSFDDGPYEIWVHLSELDFIKSLKDQQVIRYELLEQATSWLETMFTCLRKFFKERFQR